MHPSIILGVGFRSYSFTGSGIMRITVIRGSPHRHGSSNMLADSFVRGAEEAGHEVVEFDAAHSDINPCRGCDHCGMNGDCAIRDDMPEVRDMLLGSDMVMFVTPLYYFGVSAQLKMVIDRFYSYTTRLSGKHLRSALIAAAWDSNDWTMRDLENHYLTLCRYMNFRDEGTILGTGCGTPQMTERSGFCERAYQLGRSLRD